MRKMPEYVNHIVDLCQRKDLDKETKALAVENIIHYQEFKSGFDQGYTVGMAESESGIRKSKINEAETII